MARTSALLQATCVIGCLSLLGTPARGGDAPDTAILYQGQLVQSGAAVDGACDFIFSLWDAPTGGTNLGPVLQVNSWPVIGGVFTTTLDFGIAAFTGEARWLQVAVRCPAGSGPFFTLAPRQRLAGAPYTLLALNQSTLAAADGDPSPAVVVDDEGSVGIGTDTPTSTLTVNGTIESLSGGVVFPDGSMLTSADSVLSQIIAGAGLIGGGGGPSAQIEVSFAGSGVEGTVARSDHWHSMLAAADGGPADALAIDADGTVNIPGPVGIGPFATNPIEQLRVRGDAIVGAGSTFHDGDSEFLRLDGRSLSWFLAVQNESTTGNSAFFIGKDSIEDGIFNIESDGDIGIGTTAPSARLHVIGDILATGTCNCSSDARFKTNITAIDNALDRVRRLRGVFYDWRTEAYPDHHFSPARQVGVIGQEVADVLPEAAILLDDGTYSVAYGRLAAVNIEATKELLQLVEQQQDLIASLAARLELLETQIASVEHDQ
ncbi:MAG: tail fiber domain-containing protein [Phycisphaerales bacterium]|nr:tail fiber domain-containing protein [Phycisphaerales bacterium]